MPNLTNLTPEIVKNYQEEISKNSSVATVKRKSISLNKFFDWAQSEGHIDTNPMKPQTVNENPYIIVHPTNYKKIGLRTFAILGVTTSLVIIIFLLLKKLPEAIQFIKTPAQEITTIDTPKIVKTPQKSTSPLASGSPTISANPTVNGPWNLYASLKLSNDQGTPLVGQQTITFKVFNSSTGGTALYQSDAKSVTTDANGSTLISLDSVPQKLFFENNKLYLEPQVAGSTMETRIPISTANVSANLNGYFPSEKATEQTIPVIDSTGSLVLASQSPAIKATSGNFLVEGQALTLKTADGTDGNIEINPDGKGITHFLFEGTGQNFLNAQAPNLTKGSLYYGIVANNATGYDLVRLQNGSGKPVTRFSIDSLGNTYMTGNETVKGSLSVNGIANGGSYSQTSGNFTVNQNVGDFASITKTGSALADVLTLTLDERNKPTNPNSNYSTLVLNRYDGSNEAAALKVANGNAIFNGQLQLGRYAGTPSGIGQGSLVYNTNDNSVYVFDGTNWTSLGSGSGIAFNNILSGTNTSATMLVGTGASLGFTGSGTINSSSLNSLTSSQFLRSDTTDNYTSGTLTTDMGTTLDIHGNLLLNASAGTSGQIIASAGSGTPTWNDITSLLTSGADISISGTTNATIANTSTLDSVTGRGATTANTITVGNLIDSGLTASKLVFSDGSKQLTSTGTVPTDQGGTGFSSYTVGDILYADTTSTLAKLNDVATGNALISGGAGVAPSWGKIVLGTHTTGNYVSSIAGTANQIDASASTGNVTLSIPSDFRVPGTIQLNGITYTFPSTQSSNFILATDGSGTLSWADPSVVSAGSNYWNLSSGILFPKNSSADTLLGGDSTASAKFAFINTISGTPTASIAGTTANTATYLTGNGNLATTNMNHLTLGGSTTGQVDIANDLNLASGKSLLTNGTARIDTSGNFTANNLTVNGNVASNLIPSVDNTYDLGSSSNKWANVYATSLNQNGNSVCDTSGNCANSGPWAQGSGIVYTNNNSSDVLIGANSTESAKFAFTGVSSGTPIASVSGTYLTADGTLQTTNMQHLTLGGSTTGQVDVNNNLNLITGNAYQINGVSVLNSNTLGSGVINSSLTSVGALTSGSIASGFGSILTTNGITGGTLTSTGTTSFGGITYTWPASQTTNYVLTTDGSGTLSWTDPSAAVGASIYWEQANGVLNPKNSSVDVLIGATSSQSAKFAFTGVNNGTPTASISGTYITSTGNLSNTSMRNLTLGSSTTGNVVINSRGQASLTANGANLTTVGTFTLPNNNTVSGQPNFAQFSNGVSIGGGTTYYFSSAGDINANGLTVNGTTNFVGKVGSNILPLTNNTYDLGSSTFKWANVYATAFTQNGNTVCDSSDNCLVNGPWVQGAGILNPKNNSVDLLVGANSTASAKFAITGVIGNSPTATLSGTYLTSAGNLATTNMQHLTLGGSTTGQVDVSNDLNLASGKAYLINGTSVLNTNTLGSGVINSSLTSVGALTSGSIASGFGSILTTNGITGGTLTSTGTTTFGGITYTWPASQSTNYVLSTDGSGTLSWVDPAAAVASTIYWTQANGVLNPKNNTVDVLIGANSTGSAKFAFTGVNSGTPTASVSGTYLTADGTLQTTNMQHLTLGGNTTGQVDVSNDLNLASGKAYLINNTSVLNANTLGSGVINSSLTSVGALTSGSIASGFGSILTTNGITGGTLTSTGTTTFGGITYTWPGSQTTNYVLQTDGAGTLSWVDANSAVNNYWNQTNGALYNRNNTVDFLLGASSTDSAKFAVTGISTNSPTATLSGTYLTSAGNLATTNMQHLTLGGSTTGQVDVSNDLNLASGKAYLINGTSVLNTNTLGSGVVNSSLTQVGALTSGSIASGFGSILTTNGITGGTLTSTGTTSFGGLTYSWPGTQNANYVLTTDGAGTLTWTDPSTAVSASIYWTQANGVLNPKNNTVDVLIGANSTGSAKFAFTGVNSGTPTASISGTYLTSDGTLQTTNMQHLTLGGNSTGQVDVSNDLNLASGKAYLINNASVLNATTLGSSVVNSSLTQVGALASGSIASGFGTISTSNNINGASLSTNSTQRIDNSGNLTNIGTTQLNGITYTWPSSQSSSYILQTNGSGTLSWVDPNTVASSTIYWNQANGILYPKNNTVDVLIGATSSQSAKFAFTGVNSGTPTASVSGTYLTSTGNLSNTSMGGLTIGSSTTGNVTINSRGNNALVANGLNLTAGGTITLPSSNVITGLPNFVQFDNGVSVGAGTTYYFSSAGDINANAGTFAGNVAVNGGSLTTTQTTANIFTSNATSINLGASNLALTLGGNSTIYGGSNASGTLTLSSTSNATKGNIQFFTSSNTIDENGNLTLAGNATINGNTTLGNATSDTITVTGRVNSNVLPSVNATDDLGSLALSWNNIYGTSIYQNGNLVCDSAGTNCPVQFNLWNQANGALYPNNNSVDLLVGSDSTASAKFAIVGVNGSTPTATLSGTYLTSAGNLANTSMRDITLGGSTTGNVIANSPLQVNSLTASKGVFTDANKKLTSTGTLGVDQGGTGFTTYAVGDLLYADTTSSLAKLADVATGKVLRSGGVGTAPAWGDAVLSLTGTANQITASASTGDITLSIPSDFRAPGTVNAVNGLYTGATAGTQRIDNSGNLTNIGTTQLNGLTYTWPASQTNTYVLQTNGSGTLSWVDPTAITSSTIYWEQANGVLNPKNNSVDVLIGANSTASAKFAFTGVNSGTPTASISGTYLTANGTLQTTNMQHLTLGGSTTGQVDVANDLNLASGKAYLINNASVLNATTLGSSVVNSSLTSLGNLTGLTNNGNTTLGDATSDTITVTGRINSTINPSVDNTYDLGSSSLKWANVYATAFTQNGNTVCDSSGNCPGATNYWNQAQGATFTTNNTADLLIGSSATASAKFAITGVIGSTPTATLSGTYLTSAGNLANTSMKDITLGGSTTGNIIASSPFTAGSITDTGLTASKVVFTDANKQLTSTGTVGANQGGTGFSTYAVGDLLYADSTSTLAKLADVATGKVLRSGGVNTAPAWGDAVLSIAGTANQITASASTGDITLSIPSDFRAPGTVNAVNGIYTGAGAGTIRIDASGNVTTNNLTVNGTVASNLIPSANNTYDLGSSGVKWANVYATAFTQNGNTVCDSSGNCPGSTNYWGQTNGVVYPINSSVDLLIGASATTSAKFAFTGVNSGTPTASIAGTTANVATYLTGEGNLATTNMNHLTLGGSTTGQVDVSNDLNLASGKALLINNASVLNATTLGSSVVNSSLTQVGALASGSIASGFGTIATANTITGTVLNGTTGINTGAGAGTQRIDVNGNVTANDLTSTGNTTLGDATSDTITVTGRINSTVNPSVDNTYDLGSSSLKWANVYATAFTQNGNIVCDSSLNCQDKYWQLNNNILSPGNSTYDLAIGGSATGSAFQVFGIENTTGDIAKINSTVITSGNLLEATASAITSGNIIKLGTGGNNGNFTGNGILMDFDNTGGSSFTGNFLRLDKGGSNIFAINSSGDITTTGDLTLTPAGGQVYLTDTATLNVGGLTNATYNAFANASDSPVATNITADNDLFVGGDIELKGGLYLTGRNIYNVVGGVSTGTIALSPDPSLVNSYNVLGYGSWLVQNNTNNGIAALMVDQVKGGDIFTASASGVTEFVIDRSGNVTANGDVAVNGGDLTTTQTTANLFTNATTLGIGAGTGTTTINNATTAVIGNLTVGGTTGVTLSGNSASVLFSGTGSHTISNSSAGTALVIDAGTTGTVDIASNSTGDVTLAGGSGATGCTIANDTGNLVCAGNGTFAGTTGLTLSGTGAGILFSGANAHSISNSTAATNLTIDAGTSGTVDIASNSTGDVTLAGGSGATGCTITNSSGALGCSGDITTSQTTPSIFLVDTTSASDDFSINVDASTFTIRNDTDANNPLTIDGTGNVTILGDLAISGGNITTAVTFDSTVTVTGTTTTNGTLTANGVVNLGDGGDNIAINSNVWGITAAGVVSGLTGLTSSGTINLSGLTASRLVTTDASKNLASTITLANVVASISDVSGSTGSTNLVLSTSPTLTTSLLTGSTTFGLLDSTATTINFGGAATTMVIGATTGTTTVDNSLAINGNTTIGNASGDTTTVNSASWTFANDTDFTLSGGVNGLSFDGTTFSVDATNNRIGIGTAAPTATLDVQGTATVSGILTVGNGTTNTIRSPFGGLDFDAKTGANTWATVLTLQDISGNVDLGGGSGSTGCTVANSTGNLTCSGDLAINGGNITTAFTADSTVTVTGTLTANGTLDANGIFTLGDNGDTGAIDTSDWDISTTGVMTGIGAITADGTLTMSGTAANIALGSNYLSGDGGDEGVSVGSTGHVGIGITADATHQLWVKGAGAATYTAVFENGTDDSTANGLAIRAGNFNDAAGSGHLIDFYDGNGTTVGNIVWTNNVISYGTFTADHETSIPEEFNSQGYPYGTLLCIDQALTGDGINRGVGAIQYKSSACNTGPYAQNILGAYAGKDSQGDNVHQVYILGDGVIRVNGQGGDIKVGDQLTTSSTTGIGMKANDFGSTFGVAQEDYHFSSPNEVKLIAVQYGLSYHVPNLYLNSLGDATINGDPISGYTVQANGNLITKIEALATLIAGNVKAGAISAQEFVSDKLVAKVVNTNIISPIDGTTDIAIQIGSTATPSGKLAIKNAQNEEVASIDNLGNASFAGTVRSQNIDEIQTLLTQIQADQGLLAQVQNTASPSAVQNLDSLTANDIYFTNQITGLDFSITGNSINSLATPLKIQSLGMANIELMAGLITIDTNGNVNIAGNLNVAGKITTPTAEIKDITVDNFTIANATDASSSGQVVGGILTSNATAGKAVIPAGTTEITIKNNKVNDYTLVYTTPTSDTNNNVLYIKSKEVGQFVIGFTNALTTDVDFNWWIVQIKQ